jgi:hypothetical protein
MEALEGMGGAGKNKAKAPPAPPFSDGGALGRRVSAAQDVIGWLER